MTPLSVPTVAHVETTASHSQRHGDAIAASGEALMTMLRLLLNQTCAGSCSIAAVLAWDAGLWPIAVIFWLIGGHFFHTIALSFHDAAHGTLFPSRRTNEILGYLYGTLILVPLTVYRRAHAHHHSQLASAEDPELYPFVVPGTSRAFRMTCAIAEIVFGYVYTPLLFLRSVWIDKKLTRQLRRRILLEYAVVVLSVGLALTGVGLAGLWRVYLVGLLAPILVAGSYQTLRKYTEHMGLFGPSLLQLTRSVLPRDRWNYVISSLVQHVDHHGTHHLRARIPYFELPKVSEDVYRGRLEDLPVYGSYWAAFWAMLPTLQDPKTGPQWKTYDPAPTNETGQRNLMSP